MLFRSSDVGPQPRLLRTEVGVQVFSITFSFPSYHVFRSPLCGLLLVYFCPPNISLLSPFTLEERRDDKKERRRDDKREQESLHQHSGLDLQHHHLNHTDQIDSTFKCVCVCVCVNTQSSIHVQSIAHAHQRAGRPAS